MSVTDAEQQTATEEAALVEQIAAGDAGFPVSELYRRYGRRLYRYVRAEPAKGFIHHPITYLCDVGPGVSVSDPPSTSHEMWCLAGVWRWPQGSGCVVTWFVTGFPGLTKEVRRQQLTPTPGNYRHRIGQPSLTDSSGSPPPWPWQRSRQWRPSSATGTPTNSSPPTARQA